MKNMTPQEIMFLNEAFNVLSDLGSHNAENPIEQEYIRETKKRLEFIILSHSLVSQ